MTSTLKLKAAERDFFTLVHQAVLSNPFSDERAGLDRRIGGRSGQDSLQHVLHVVRDRIERLETAGRGDYRRYGKRDGEIVRSSILFDYFHRFCYRLDEHIERQAESGGRPLKISLAPQAFSHLAARGFAPAEVRHFFALAFQIRRAYYFIDRGLVGGSPCLKALRASLWNNVFTSRLDLYSRYLWNRMEDFSTLLLGETGTGKGTAAMAIGRSGFIPFDEENQRFAESFARSFTSINLSQYPETIIESELFGHCKGAFTGAVGDHQGVLQRCSPHGAIFLDEIGEVAAPVQIKLLKVLEERLFSPVGSHEEDRFAGRVIAATNRPVQQLLSGGVLREDFFYRLCSDLIVVPPLRQRIREDPAELDELLGFTVTRILGAPSLELATLVRRVIDRDLGRGYAWPGNVRELAQCVRRILLNHRYRSLHPEPAAAATGDRLLQDMAAGRIDAQCLLKGYCHRLYQRLGTYGEVARRTRLDRRTVKKYIIEWEATDRRG